MSSALPAGVGSPLCSLWAVDGFGREWYMTLVVVLPAGRVEAFVTTPAAESILEQEEVWT